MTNVVDLARLSEAVYEDQPKVGQWLRRGLPYTVKGSSYKSAIYAHMETDDFAFAIAGTDEIGDIASDWQLFIGRMPDQYRVARSAYLAAGQLIFNLGGMYLTGHSLGGGLASMLAKEHGDPVVTFNAPGMARAFADLKHREPGLSTARDEDRKVLHICSHFDLVSRGTGAHMGGKDSVRRLSTKTPKTAATAGSVLLGVATSVFTGPLAVGAGVVAAAVGIVEGHSIRRLVSALERKKEYEQDLGWI